MRRGPPVPSWCPFAGSRVTAPDLSDRSRILNPPLPAVPPARTAPAILVANSLVGLSAILIPAWIVSVTPRVVVTKYPNVIVSHHVVPKEELPAVEPVTLQSVDPNDARAVNASVPFSTLPNPAARPFRLTGSAVSQARALDCMTAALVYEAGDDPVGQRAVAQTVINRARHPAFPSSICGVVFQGQERSTGCQFTFSCDGALTRWTPTPSVWERAREIARRALNGSVDRRVGHATHYHTNWVVPYWSASLEKITEINTHIFFRWAGWWGTPPAFAGGYAANEPNVPKLARLSPNHVAAEVTEAAVGPLETSGAIIDPATIPASAIPPPMPVEAGGDSNNFMLTLPTGMAPDAFAALAIRTCGERPYCKFMAWADASATPSRLPLTSAQVASMSFSYLRDEKQGFAKALWNCQQYRRPSPVQCMRAQILTSAPPTRPTTAVTPTSSQAALPSTLEGIRRKGDTAAPGPVATTPLPPPTTQPAPAQQD